MRKINNYLNKILCYWHSLKILITIQAVKEHFNFKKKFDALLGFIPFHLLMIKTGILIKTAGKVFFAVGVVAHFINQAFPWISEAFPNLYIKEMASVMDFLGYEVLRFINPTEAEIIEANPMFKKGQQDMTRVHEQWLEMRREYEHRESLRSIQELWERHRNNFSNESESFDSDDENLDKLEVGQEKKTNDINTNDVKKGAIVLTAISLVIAIIRSLF